MNNGLRIRCLARWGILGTLLLALTACGGGGGGGGGGFLPNDPSDSLTRYRLSLSLLDADGNPVTQISPNRSTTLRVEVREDNPVAAVVEGVIVDAVTDLASLDPENGSALTDSSGVATFELTGRGVRGADTVTVSVTSPAGVITATQNYQVLDVELRLDVELVDADGLATTFIAPEQPGSLLVTVTEIDEDGVTSIPAEPIVVTATAGFATILPQNGSALTNPNGVATFELQSGTTSGADTVTVQAVNGSGDEFEESLSFQIFTDDDSFSLSLALVNGSGAITNEIDAASPGTLLALLTRSNPLLGIDAQTVAGQIITVTSSDGIITPENGAALTDSSGTATFGVAVGSALGAQTLTASVNAPGGPVSAELPYQVVADVAGPGFEALFLELELRDAEGRPDDSFERGQTALLRVRVLGRRAGTQSRVRVPGIPISVSAPGGLSSILPGSLISDDTGEANFIVEMGNASGADVLNATILGPQGPVTEAVSYDVSGTSLQFNTVLLDAAGLRTSYVAPGQPGRLRVTVRELNPDGSTSVPDEPIVVSAEAGLVEIDPDNGAILTDSNGVAEFLLTAGSVSGATIVELSANAPTGESFTDDFPLQVFTEDDVFTLSLALLNANGAVTTQIDASSPGQLVVLLRRSNSLAGISNEAVAGQIVELSVTDGSVTPQNGRRVTNALGEARFGVAAGDTIGAQIATVTVNAPGGIVATELPYEVVANTPASGFEALFVDLTLRDAAGTQTDSVLPGENLFLDARVTGRRPGSSALLSAAGVPVSLVAQTGSVSPALGNVISNNQGIASFRITAGTSSGTDVLSATVVGPLGPVIETINYEIQDVDLVLLPVLLDANDEETSFISTSRPGTLRVQVLQRRTGGSLEPPTTPVTVEATANLAVISPDTGTTVTDDDGFAFFQMSAGTTSGADLITVSVSATGGDPLTASLPIDVLTDEDSFALSLTLLGSDGAVTTQLDRASPATLVARLTRNNSGLGISGEPVAGQVINASISGDGSITPDNGAALTDAVGEARFGIAAGNTLGAETATVSVDGPGGTVTAQLSYEVVNDVGGGGFVNLFLSLRLLDEEGNEIDSLSRQDQGTLEIFLEGRRAGSQVREPAAGIAVSANAQNSSLQPDSGTLLTDTAGIARFTVSAANAPSGTDSASATVISPAGPLTRSISFDVLGDGLLSLSLINSAGQSSNIVRLNDPLTLNVLLELNGQPREGVIIEASTDTAVLSPANGRALTNASGIAQFALSAGEQTGAGTVTVTTVGDGAVATGSINYEVLESRFDLQLSLVDANGDPTTRVTSAQPATLLVQAISLNVPAEPVSGFVATATGNLVRISPEAGTALTDASGIAEFTLSAGDTAGADLITVSIDTGTALVTETIGVDANASDVRLGAFIGGTFNAGVIDFIVSDLPFGGATRFNLAVIDDLGELVAEDNQIRLTSDCAIRGEAGLRAVGDTDAGSSVLLIDTVQGLASAEYNAIDCVGSDEVRATLVGENENATGTVTIAEASANYIGFFETVPAEGPETGDRSVIALAGTGSEPVRPELARVTFEVLASRPEVREGLPGPGEAGYLERDDRVPVTNAEVVFTLSNDVAGMQLCDPEGACTNASSLTLQTDQDGLVTVGVQSGSVPSQTFARASYTNPNTSITVFATSNEIVVSTGVPDQNSFSISVMEGFYVADSANFDGRERTITARLGDRFNNPVPDGTTVVFRTEYGAIDASCETGVVNGARLVERNPGVIPERGLCSVLWSSQDPRLPPFLPSSGEELVLVDGRPINGRPYNCPSHNGSFGPCPDDLGPVRGLRSSILAYALGDEDFSDSDGNGLYSAGEPFNNCLEEFIDYNENASYSANFFEEFIDLDNNNSYGDSGELNGAAVYNGTLCSRENEASGVCSRDLVNVSARCALDPALQGGRVQVVLTLSSSGDSQLAVLERTADDTVLPSGSVLELGVAHAVHIADIYNNRPGNGTEVTVSIDERDACVVFVEGNFIGGDNPDSFSLILNDAGDAPGATTLSPIVVTNDDPTDPDTPNVGGTILLSVDGFFLTSFSCN